MKHYDEGRVLRQLDKKTCKINYADHTISIPFGATDIGIHSWGKLDFLQKYCGWRVFRVDNAVLVAEKQAEREAKKQARKEAKEAKKNAKLSIANMVKKVIKKPKVKQ